MPLLTWKHGTTRAEAKDAIVEELRKLGFEKNASWKDNEFTASVGWGQVVLGMSGNVTDDEIILNKCSGALGSTVLSKCREMLERAFPGGEQP